MTRFLFAALATVAAAGVASAHFVYVVPAAGKLTVVFSDDLKPDAAVDVTKIAALKLTARDAAGKDTPLTLTKGEHCYTASAGSAQLVFGAVDYGVTKRGDAPAFLLRYHPKAVLGGTGVVGAVAEVELIAVTEGGSTRLRFVASGQPVAGAEVSVHLGDETHKLTTGPDGLTPALKGSGRLSAWAKRSTAKTGELGGKTYAEVRDYATLVTDLR